MKTSRLFMGTFIALSMVSAQLVRADDKPVMLALTPKANTVAHFKINLAVSMMGNEVAKVEQRNKSEIKEVKKDGSFTVASFSEGVHVNGPGGEQDLPGGPVAKSTRDKFGKLIEFTPEPGGQEIFAPEVVRLQAMLSQIIFPEKAVKAGDNWETSLDNPADKGKKLTVKTTYVGTEKVDGVDVWKVKQTAEVVIAGKDAKLITEYTAWLDPATGDEVKADVSLKNLPASFGGMEVIIDTAGKMVAVKADKEKAEPKKP
jgi:hypothetical protein